MDQLSSLSFAGILDSSTQAPFIRNNAGTNIATIVHYLSTVQQTAAKSSLDIGEGVVPNPGTAFEQRELELLSSDFDGPVSEF